VSLNLGLVKRVFADGFESGSMSGWSTNSGLVVQATSVHAGAYAARATSIGPATYARATLGSGYSNLYGRAYFLLKSQPFGTVSIIGFRSTAGASIARLYIDTQGRLGLRNDMALTSTAGPLLASALWHSVELHLIVNGTSSTIEVWLDGNLVPALTSQAAASLGTALIGQVQIGENQVGRSYDVAFDDVVVQTARVGA
jgi:hypothetical protein